MGPNEIPPVPMNSDLFSKDDDVSFLNFLILVNTMPRADISQSHGKMWFDRLIDWIESLDVPPLTKFQKIMIGFQLAIIFLVSVCSTTGNGAVAMAKFLKK
jgi:hypothetical protein